MNSFKRTARATFAMALVVVLLVSGLSSVFAQDSIIYIASSTTGDDIPTLDPSLAESSDAIQALHGMYIGLTILNETTVAVEPGMATDWEVSEDGMVYTFNLLQDIPWVIYDADAGEVVQVTDENGDVRMVTANDFVYAWQRTLTPGIGSYYAGVLADFVANGNEAVNGEVETSEIGIVALDDYTVQVTATQAGAFLPNIYGMWMAYPQPQWAVEEYGDVWAEAGNMPSYGPYALKEWLHDESITYIKNPFWPGTDYVPQASIEEINDSFLEQSAALAAFEAGELDWFDSVPLSDIDRVRVEYPDSFYVGPGTCTYYYGFNTQKEPFTNANIRRAFSIAIDRYSLVENVLRAGQQPAGMFTRPDQGESAPNQVDFPQYSAAVIEDDAERAAAAQEALNAYFEETGTTVDDLPPITLVHNESEAHARIAEAIQQMWVEDLGIEVQISSMEWAVFLDLRDNDAPQIFRAAWCYDYQDPHNWLYDVMRSDSNPETGSNDMNWANEEFDALVDAALVESDPAVRQELYAQAEGLLNADAAIAPIYYYTTTGMVSTELDRPFANSGTEFFAKWSFK